MPYQPPSQRSRRSQSRSRKGPIIFCCMLVLIAGFIAFVIYESKKPEPVAPKITISKPKPQAPSFNPSSENEARQKDAQAVYYAGGNFYRANVGKYPTAYSNGKVTGAPDTKAQPLSLQHYQKVSFVTGTQKPVNTDEIRFVYNAVCSSAGSATDPSTQDYAYVVQYALQQQDGSFSASCLRM